MHDGLGQYLTVIALKAKCLSEELQTVAPNQAAAADELVRLINDANRQARTLARGMDPIAVEAHGLIAALENLALECEQLFSIQCVFRSRIATLSISKFAAVQVYRIAQEAINNAVRHGQAQTIQVELAKENQGLRLCVRDDGKGFCSQANGRTGSGLGIMGYRADALRGILKVDSAPGHGAAIECWIPLADTAGQGENKGHEQVEKTY